MGWEGWYTIAVTCMSFGVLALTRTSADAVMVGGLTLLLVGGVLDTDQALAGLANEGMVTVGVLYVVVAGIRDTGGINWIVHTVLGRPRSISHAQLRLMSPVAVMSMFLNNTPVVGMFIPAASDWARRHQISISRLMIPLSYASIAGGVCTLIGTSTNLVVNGMLIQETGSAGLSMFEIAWIGIPLTVLVFLFVLLGNRWLLPDRVPVISRYHNAREYTVEMLVDDDGVLDGKTVEEAGLRNLPGLFLMEIDRNGRIIPAVSSRDVIYSGDRLVFAGVVESVIDLQKIKGIKPASNQVYKLDVAHSERILVEAVVSKSCPLVGRTVRAGRFRNVYNAAIIAVGRNGRRVTQKVGDIVLQPGDTLLLEGHRSFFEQQRNSRDFFLVSEVEDAATPQHNKAAFAMVILAAMVISVTLNWLTMLEASMLAAGAMILTGCTSGRTARRSVDWSILIVIAASFGFGNALQITGAAATIANTLIGLAAGDPMLSLGLLFAVTAMLSALATNNAAAVIMFPIALTTAAELGVDFMPFVIASMVAASASFATPIGYQTNLMVFGVGGYHFSDFIRIGLPLTILAGLLTVLLVPMHWPF